MRNKIIPFVVSLIIAINCFMPFSIAEANGDNAEIAYAYLGEKPEIVGFEKVETGNGGTSEPVTRGGLECWLLNNQTGNSKAYINMNLKEEFKKNSIGSVYSVTVQYYDSGNGYFRFLYDKKGYENKEGAIVEMEGLGVWRTKEFLLNDAKLENKVEGWDLRLCITARSSASSISASSVAIRSIVIKKYEGKNPVYLDSFVKRAGNVFEWFSDEKIIYNRYENLTPIEKNAVVKHKFTDKNGYVAYEYSEEINLSGKEIKETQLDFSELERCGVYWYSAEISDKAGEFNSLFKPFEIVIVKTDPDGIRDEYAYYCHHLDRYSNDIADMGADIIAMSNVAGVRTGISWSENEYVQGNFDFGPKSDDIKRLADKGFKMIVQVSNPPERLGGYNVMPNTEYALSEWRNYVKQMVSFAKEYADTYEIWNEPNIASFNKNFNNPSGDGKVYAELFRIASEEIKKAQPEAKVAGASITGSWVDSYRKYYDDAIDAGLWKYLDAISSHGYPYERFEKQTVTHESEQKLYDLYSSAGGKGAEMWQTEVGTTTTDAWVGSPYQQGIQNCRTALFRRRNKSAELFAFYCFERKDCIGSDREDCFGHCSGGYPELSKYNTYFVPTEAFVIITGMNYVMAQSEPVAILDDPNRDIYISQYRSDIFNKDLIELHTYEKAENVSLRLGTDSIKVYDECGNEKVLYGKNGVFSFVLTEAPMYLAGDFTMVELLDKCDFGFGEYEIRVAEHDSFKMNLTVPDTGNYKVEFDLPEGLMVSENKEFKDKKAVIVLENTSQAGNTYGFTARIMEGDKAVGIAEYKVEVTESVIPELNIILDSVKDTTLWTGKIKLHNISSGSTVKGKLNFDGPELFEDLQNINLGIIPAGKVGEVSFALPKISKKGLYTLEYNLCLSNGVKYDFKENIDFTLAKYADKKPVIDGEIQTDEWPGDIAMYADDVSQIKNLPDWMGKNDISGFAIIQWDEENVYLCAEATDDVHCNISEAGSNWNGDNLQFGMFYGTEGFTAIGQASTKFNEISIALNSNTGEVSVWRYLTQHSDKKIGKVENAECMIKRDDNFQKTVYELKIPWSELLADGEQPKEGEKVGFSFVFNETDAGLREGWIEYAGGIAETKNAQLFTYMTLLK